MFRMRLFSISLFVVLVFTLAVPQSGQAAGVVERTSSAPINASIPSRPLLDLPGVIFRSYVSNTEPSTYETVWFFASIRADPSYWPYPPTIPSAFTWFFDGIGGPSLHGSSVSYSYNAEGTYLVYYISDYSDPLSRNRLLGSITITVRTHDVAVSDMKVHKNMHTGQIQTVSVDVVSNRYEENVQVQLYKSLNGGAWLPVRTSAQQLVPVGLTKHPVSFMFDYPVVPEDALAGTIAFKATAVIVGHYESLPADNTMLSEPVEVKK